MAAIPAGRRLINQVRGEPTKWLMATACAARIGALRRAPPGTRLVSRHKPHGHGGPSYVALVGVAAGVVTLVCFYLCVWLVRHQRRQRTFAARQLPVAPSHHHHNAHQEEEGDRPDEMKTTRPGGDGDSATQTWSSESGARGDGWRARAHFCCTPGCAVPSIPSQRKRTQPTNIT